MRISTKCSIAIHCLLFVHEYGGEGKVTSDWMARSTGCNPVVIRSTVSALKKAGILDVRPGTGGTRLACPPEEIDLCRVFTALEPDCLDKLVGLHPNPSRLCPVGRSIHGVLESTYRKVHRDLQASLRSITLADILEEYHRADGK